MVKEKKLEEKKVTKNSKTTKNYIHAVGRRREAIARVRLYPETKEPIMWGETVLEKGSIFVNGKKISEYFSGDVAKIRYELPYKTANVLDKFTTTIIVAGGGKNGQLDAAVHGIARAIVSYDKEKFRPLLKKKGLLTRDQRARERRKVGTGGKARRKKQSPKR